MRFFNLLWLLACFAPSLSAASPTVDDIRTAIASKDHAQATTLLNTAQADFLDGTLTAQDIRTLYRPLIQSHPDTVTFVADWIEHDPDNPKVQVARAWSLFNGSYDISKAPNALSAYVTREMRSQAWDLFTSAYKADNALIPASDAAMRGFVRQSFSVPDAHVALMRTLRTHPNWGSINRYLNRDRFETERASRDFCSHVAGHFSLSQKPVIENRCLMQIGANRHFAGLHAYIDEHFWRDNDPATTVFRLSYLLEWSDRRKLTKRHIAWAKDVVLHQPFAVYELDDLPYMVHHLNLAMQVMEDIPAQDLTTEFRKVRLPEVEEFLKDDPYNVKMLDLLEGTAFASEMIYTKTKTGTNSTKMTSTVVRVERSPAEEEAFKAAKTAQRKDIAIKRLGASPYHPQMWYDYGRQANISDSPYSTFSGDAALENSVVFSDDPAQFLQYILNHKREEYMFVKELSEMDMSQVLPEYLDDFTRRVAWAKQTDVDSRITCPYARAKRLYDAICKDYPFGAIQCDPSMLPSYDHTEELETRAATAPACEAIHNANLDALWYVATPFKQAIVPMQ